MGLRTSRYGKKATGAIICSRVMISCGGGAIAARKEPKPRPPKGAVHAVFARWGTLHL